MDGRKNNGGNSTKSKDGFDKRKNEYRTALEQASSVDDVVAVIKAVKQKAIDKKDIQAAKLFLEYYLGKPKETMDVTTNGDNISFNELIKYVKD